MSHHIKGKSRSQATFFPEVLDDFISTENPVRVIDVFVEDHRTGAKTKCNDAIYTFVAVDQMGSPIEAPEVIPETEEEKKRYEGALRRKQLSLILAGKMKPSEATELKKLFLED